MLLSPTTLIGVLGALIILVCFVGNEIGKFDRGSLGYDSANAFGSLLLLVYAYLLGSWPFLILNAIWALVSLRDVIKTLAQRSK